MYSFNRYLLLWFIWSYHLCFNCLKIYENNIHKNKHKLPLRTGIFLKIFEEISTMTVNEPKFTPPSNKFLLEVTFQIISKLSLHPANHFDENPRSEWVKYAESESESESESSNKNNFYRTHEILWKDIRLNPLKGWFSGNKEIQ